MVRFVVLFVGLVLSPATSGDLWAAEAAPIATAEIEEKEAALKRLVKFLKSISDDDYAVVLGQLSAETASRPEMASRAEVLKSAYAALAKLEYRQASEHAPEEATPQHSEASDRILKEVGPAIAVDSETREETGWLLDLLKWLGDASMNYWLYGGTESVGNQGSKAGQMTQSSLLLDTQMAEAAAGDERRAETHSKLGAIYEELASAAVEPQSDDERIAKRTARLRQVAEFLVSLSEEDYQAVLQRLPPEAAGHPELASLAQVTRSAYRTLAALEYNQAARHASGRARYANAYQRIVQEDADSLAVHPETLQEIGWLVDLLKWLGNANMNYWLYGDEDFIGGGGAKAGKLRKRRDELQAELAQPALGQEEEAGIHFKLGTVYEKMASTAAKRPATHPRPGTRSPGAEEEEGYQNAGTSDEPGAQILTPVNPYSADDFLKREMDELDKMGKEMALDIDRRRAKTAPAGDGSGAQTEEAAQGQAGEDGIETGRYTEAGAQARVTAPVFVPPGGQTFPNGIIVTIVSPTSGATVRYTTNGAEPTSYSAIFSRMITLRATTTLKAKAFKSGMADSAVASATYTRKQAVATPSISPASPVQSPAPKSAPTCSIQLVVPQMIGIGPLGRTVNVVVAGGCAGKWLGASLMKPNGQVVDLSPILMRNSGTQVISLPGDAGSGWRIRIRTWGNMIGKLMVDPMDDRGWQYISGISTSVPQVSPTISTPSRTPARKSLSEGVVLGLRVRIYRQFAENLTAEGWAAKGAKTLNDYGQNWMSAWADPMNNIVDSAKGYILDKTLPSAITTPLGYYDTAKDILEQARVLVDSIRRFSMANYFGALALRSQTGITADDYNRIADAVSRGDKTDALKRIRSLKSALGQWRFWLQGWDGSNSIGPKVPSQAIKFMQKEVEAASAFLTAEEAAVQQP